MAKYKLGDRFRNNDKQYYNVKSKIIFVPPVDGEGKQYYLEEVYSIHANGGKKMFLSLSHEEDLDRYFVKRTDKDDSPFE